MSTKVLEVHLVGDGVSLDRTLSTSAKAATSAATTMEAAGARMTRVGTRMSSVGKSWTHHIGLPLAAVGIASVKMAADFGRSMGEIQTQAGGSEKEVKKFTDQIRNAASHGRFAQSNDDIAKSLYNIESGGYRAAKAWKIEKSAADFATVGHADLESTTSALVGVMKTGVKGAGDSQKAIGALNATIGAGKMHMEDLNAAIGTGFLGSAKAFGISIYGAGAALAELTAQGVPAASAATRLRMVMSLMGAPTEKAQKVLEGIGIGSEDLAKKMQSSGGVLTALELLQEKMAGMTKIEQTQLLASAFGGAKSGGTVLQLIGNLDDLSAKQKQVLENSDDINEAIKHTNSEPAVKMEKAWRSIENSLEELGETLLPVASESFEDIAGTISDLGEKFHDLDKGTQSWILKIGGALIIGGPILMGAGKLVSVWGKLVSMIGKATVALGIFEAEQATAGAAGGVGSVAGAAGTGLLGGGTRTVAGAGIGGWIGAPVVAQTERGVATSALANSGGVFGGIAGGAGAGVMGGMFRGSSETGALGGIFRSEGGIKGAGQVLGRTLLGVAGGYITAELGLHGLEALGVKDPTEGQGIFAGLTHGFKTSSPGKGKRSEAEGSELMGRNLLGVRPSLSVPDAKKLKNQFHGLMNEIGGDAIWGMGNINQDLGQGLRTATTLFDRHTPMWHKMTAQAMKGAIRSIQDGMDSGTIDVKKGQKEINQLLRKIKFVQGRDPLKIAEGMANSFQQAGGVTKQFLKQWTGEIELMPIAQGKAAAQGTEQMLQAWAQGHPKLEKQIDQLTNYQIRKFGATNKQLREGVKKGATGPVADAYKELAGGVGSSLQNIGVNTQQVLKALGVKNIPAFQIALITGGEGKFDPVGEGPGAGHTHRQTGGPVGFTVPGDGDGDRFHTAVPARSFVLNREASQHFGFQNGGHVPVGHVPVSLEAKERVFYPQEVERIGLGTLHAMNAAVSRFQEGGLAIPHPKLTGGLDPLREGGQNVIDRGYHGATAYIKKHAEPPRILHALHAMEDQAHKGYPYVFGGGHGSFSGPFDCSGFVSYGLHAAGFIDAPLSVQQGSGLYTLGAAGPGKYLTWGVRGTSGANAHTMMSIKKPGTGGWGFFESGGSGGGAHEDQGWDGAFQFRHMPGFQEGGSVGPGMPKKAKDAVDKYGQKAFDPKDEHFVGWGYEKGGEVGSLGDDLRHRAARIWKVAAPFYGQSPQSDPPFIHAGGPRNARTIQYGDNSRGIYMGHHLSNELLGGKGNEHNWAEETLVHEWAHYFQKGLGLKNVNDKNRWKLEGGAEAFARWAAPQIMEKAGLGYEQPYPLGYKPFVDRVLKEKSPSWIRHGQFGFQKGGLVGGGGARGFSVGGPVPPKGGEIVGASYYGGPTDSTSGTEGYKGDSLPGTSSFAELAGGTALGGLPHHAKLKIDYGGKSVVAEKLDTGTGGDDVDGHNRAIDLWYETANALGMPGTAVVKVAPTKAGISGTAKTETVPGMFHGLHTGSLSYPSVPKNITGMNREIFKRKEELTKYRHAVKKAKGQPKLEHALQANVTSLEDRLKVLRRERTKLKRDIVKKRFKKRLAKKLGKITGYGTKIGADERALEKAEQFAQQVVDLEPTQSKDEDEKTFESKFDQYVEGQEKPAYEKILGLANDLRNTILGAEMFGFGKDHPSADDMEHVWEGNIRKLTNEIEATEDFQKKVSDRVADWRKTHGKAAFPDWLKTQIQERDKRVGMISMQKFKRGELETTLGGARDEFYRGGKHRLDPPKPPLPGSGSFEDAMVNVQGIHWPDQHERLSSLPSAPVAGRFGGMIWDTQMAIRELGLKIAEAGGAGSGADDTANEKLALVEEMRNRERTERLSVEANLSVMAGLGKIGPKGLKTEFPWAGRYASGGYVDALVGEEGPEIASLPPGTKMRGARESAGSLAPKVEVNNHHYPDHTETEVFVDGQRMDAIVNHVREKLGGSANHRAQTSSSGKVGTLG